MGKTVFHDLYSLSKHISTYLPLSQGLPLEQEVGMFVSNGMPSSVPEGEHWAIFAKTGDGKTVFDKALLRSYRQVYPWINTYILDTKKLGDFTDRDGKIWRTYDPPPPLTGIGQRQVWQPIADNMDAYDTYFTNILQTGKPAVVLVDESKNLKFGNRAPKGYELILAQGRLPGIHVITNYQEIANGLRQGLSQPKHIVGFSMWNPYDERQMKAALRWPSAMPLPQKGQHALLYINRDKMAQPVLFNGYQEFNRYFLQAMRMRGN